MMQNVNKKKTQKHQVWTQHKAKCELRIMQNVNQHCVKHSAHVLTYKQVFGIGIFHLCTVFTENASKAGVMTA